MSASTSSSDTDLTTRVEAVLNKASKGTDRPLDSELGPCYNFLIPPSSSSTPPAPHWYCEEAKSDLHRRAASYLLFLFAFRRQGTSQIWVDTLEDVLRRCEGCARGFGIARREFGDLYMAGFPQSNRVNFFAAVDRWQVAFIVQEATKTKETTTSHEVSEDGITLASLSVSIAQLLFSEPSLLDIPELKQIIDATVSATSSSSLSNVTSLGITPLLVRLLRSPVSPVRKWARTLLPTAGRRKLSFEIFVRTGVQDEVEALCGDSERETAISDSWEVMADILRRGCLSDEAIERGLLRGETIGAKKSSSRGIMAVLITRMGTESNVFPHLLQVFALLLNAVPNRSFWHFDPSPELPHTLFSDIKNNPSFSALLEQRYSGSPSTASISTTTKATALNVELEPFGWVEKYVLSLLPSANSTRSGQGGTGFGEALARIMGDCLEELQHSRHTASLQAAAAKAGVDVLTAILEASRPLDENYNAVISSVLDIHAKFINAVALRSDAHPHNIWAEASQSSRDLLSKVFLSDGRDLLESMLGLSLIANEERKRQQKVKKAKLKGDPAPAPVPVTSLHKAAVRKEMWTMAYNALSPTDSAGTAILLNSVASFAHIEKLNRDDTWSYSGLKLKEVVKEDDFVASVRAINTGLVTSRDPFAHAMESLAMQPDPMVAKSLWDQPGVPRSAVILLLSPAEDVHDPTISLIQQSFDNVDDRSDCFRTLLTHFPSQAMDGLCDFLASFIDMAKITPESCSLAKWLVRCFTDILDALCQASEEGEPLLQSSAFISTYADGLPMSRRVANLWHLMTTALAVIFKRTIDWAPFYDNETMVDWMRDALIFGRQMTEHIRAFEAAALGVPGGNSNFEAESPLKPTKAGAKLVQKLEVVLRDLVSWLRLTDVETLHQTFELVRTIVGRIAKVTPDVTQAPQLEATLLELDKFSRKASKSYRTRLSDDLLSELSDMLTPFNLEIGDEDIQYVKSVELTSGPASRVDSVSASSRSAVSTPAPPSTTAVKPPKNAFEEMMRRAGASSPAPGGSSPIPPKSRPAASQTVPTGSKGQPHEVVEVDDDDDFDDGFFDDISAADLEQLEQTAKTPGSKLLGTTKLTYGTAPARPKPGTQPRLTFPTRPGSTSSSASASGQRLNINVVPKAPPKPTGTGFKSQLMRDARMAHRAAHFQRDRNIGGITPKVPAASGLGTGLGAYQGPRRPVQPVDSGSSASDSSDDDKQGVNALAARQNAPKKIARIVQPIVERRPIKMIGTDMSDVIRQREDRRAAQHALKMRLKPDLNGLYRYVLAWNPDHTGQAPPHPPQHVLEIGPLGQVPTVFPDTDRYRKVMLPLFLQELWMQCLKETSTAFIPIEIASRAYEDQFLDMEVTIQGNVPHDFHVNETDIVLLKQPGARSVLAKVQGFKRKFKDTAMKVRILNMMDQNVMGVKSKWQLQKHVGLSTALREYGALQGLPWYDSVLLSNILGARSAKMPRLDEEDIRDAKRAFDTNEPQARAILGAMSIDGFALIQGPPGTGKTKTISGLVGKFLSDRSGIIPIQGEKPTKPKLLVCAPSNAAIDEVCKRLMNGVPSSAGGRHTPNIVRIGIESAVNMAVKSVSLDNLVEARVTSGGGGKEGGGDYQRIQAELDGVKKQISVKQDELQKLSNNDERRKQVEHEYQGLIQRRTQLGQQSSKAKDAARDATRHLEGARRAAREAILNEADIVCATLSGAGQDSLAQFTFETVIIDEAAQAIEMSCLIPLKYGCRRCIMVGDPNQLPPTTFSSDAERFHYNESLFVRMVRQSPANVQLLSIQYRMNPYISELPSKVFYHGQLKDGPDMDIKTKAIWHEKPVFGPYRFFNVNGTESKTGTSTKNVQEALVAVELYRKLEDDFGDKVDFALRIGVISMYKEQLWELKRKFIDAYGSGILERIEFNTVDGFQGQEKDIIILSCVRSGPNLQSIGFLKDPRRMNVALTRAKSSLFIIGNGPTLERTDDRWRTIVGDARERGFYADYGPDLFTKRIDPPVVKKAKKERASSPVPSKPAASINPPTSVMDGAQALKRKSDAGIKTDDKKPMIVKIETGETTETDKKRKIAADQAQLPEKKKKKKNRDLDKNNLSRASSPMPVASSDSQTSAVASKGISNAQGPQVKGLTGTHGNPIPPPPTSMPPPLPPAPPPPRIPGPPPAAVRKPEDVLFVKKKKKKPNGPGMGGPSAGPPGAQGVRAAIKDQLQGGHR